MQPTLIIMAAGMGSRYGGLKQMDGVGPSGETLMDYSIYDALEAGFREVVFVIRKDFMDDFRQLCAHRYGNRFPYDFVTQDMDNLPGGIAPAQGRTKPWGTGHALWVTAEKVGKPLPLLMQTIFMEKMHSGFCTVFWFNKENVQALTQWPAIGWIIPSLLPAPCREVSVVVIRQDY